jgi:hypothetical protein
MLYSTYLPAMALGKFVNVSWGWFGDKMYHRLDLPVRWKQQWLKFFYTRSSSSKYNRIVCRKQCKQACKFMPYRAQATTLPTECTLQNASHISLVLSRRQTSQCKISNTRSTLSHNNRTKFNPCLFNKRIVLCNTKYNALYYVRLPITKKSKFFLQRQNGLPPSLGYI